MSTHSMHALPVVIIGAGPVGLAAAVHVLSRGLEPLVLEAGAAVGAAMRSWAHVRMFSPWEYNVDPLAAALLARHGWSAPDPATFPTGGELVARFLEPLATTPELAGRIRLDARVIAVSRQARDRMKNDARASAPFLVRYVQGGVERELLAQAMIDASGTLATPNPIGAAGIPALGERAAGAHLKYGMPEVLGAERRRYAGRRVLVVGSGHSAFNVLMDLSRLALEAPDTQIHWAVRRPSLRRVLGGGENDQLRERGALGMRIAQLVERGVIVLHAGVYLDRIERTADGWVAWSGSSALPAVDELVGATGFRPDYSMLDELRLDLDPGTQAPSVLAPLIDPNLHSCGTVRPHGALQLQHPDENLYVVGMKSYGRAPTFLLLTGYEQVRSVAAAIAGDLDAARRVELKVPETGVCSIQFADEEEVAGATAGGCCGGPAPAPAVARASCGSTPANTAEVTVKTGGCSPKSQAAKAAVVEQAASCCGGPAPDPGSACCVADAQAKASGASGCGCAQLETAAVASKMPLAVAPAIVVTESKSSNTASSGCCSAVRA